MLCVTARQQYVASQCITVILNPFTGSPSTKQSAAQGARSPAPKVHSGTFLPSGVKVSWETAEQEVAFTRMVPPNWV